MMECTWNPKGTTRWSFYVEDLERWVGDLTCEQDPQYRDRPFMVKDGRNVATPWIYEFKFVRSGRPLVHVGEFHSYEEAQQAAKRIVLDMIKEGA